MVETDKETPMESAQEVIRKLESLEYIPMVSESVIYSDAEEAKIQERLKALGYI